MRARSILPTMSNNSGGRRIQPGKLTKTVKEKFLKLLAENGGIISDAAEDIDISRCALYALKQRDEEFAEAWNTAQDQGIDVLEDEAKRRSLTGTEEPVYFQGDVVGHIRKKSDALMQLILKAHRKKYRISTTEISGPDGSPVTTTVLYLPRNGREEDGQ